MRRPAGQGFVVACRACGTPAVTIRRYRSLAPARDWLRDVATFALRGGGWRAFVAGAGIFAALRLMWLPGALVANAMLVTWMFQLARATRSGSDELSGPTDLQHAGDELLRLLNLTGAVLVGFGPAALWLVARDLVVGPGASLSWVDIPGLALAAFGLVWSPFSTTLIALDTPLYLALNPVVALRTAILDGSAALRLAASFWALGAAWWWTGELAAGLLPLPNLGLAFAEPLRLVLALALARALGLHLRAFAGRGGWGLAWDDSDPVLGPVMPREIVPVVLREDEPEDPSARRVEPIEIPGLDEPPALAGALADDGARAPDEPLRETQRPSGAVEGELTDEAEFEAMVYGTRR